MPKIGVFGALFGVLQRKDRQKRFNTFPHAFAVPTKEDTANFASSYETRTTNIPGSTDSVQSWECLSIWKWEARGTQLKLRPRKHQLNADPQRLPSRFRRRRIPRTSRSTMKCDPRMTGSIDSVQTRGCVRIWTGETRGSQLKPRPRNNKPRNGYPKPPLQLKQSRTKTFLRRNTLGSTVRCSWFGWPWGIPPRRHAYLCRHRNLLCPFALPFSPHALCAPVALAATTQIEKPWH